MKWRFIVSISLLLVCIYRVDAQSCCCTGAGANYSILPNLNKHIIGLRWTYSQYDNVSRSLNPDLDGIKNKEQLNTLELFGRFNVARQLQLSVFVPVSFVHQHSKIDDEQSAGLGDMTFLLQYSFFDPLKCHGKKSKHQFRLGLGTKLPSGEFKKGDNNFYNTSIQSGSGSIDFIANAIYTFRYKGFGLNTQVAYKANTANPQTFRFGDKIEGGLNLFYVIPAGKLNLMPSVGVSYAHLFNNYNRHQPVYYSASNLILATVSLDADVGHFAFNVSVSPVLYNHVNMMAFEQRFTTGAGVFYTF